jgi:hypothetical protein
LRSRQFCGYLRASQLNKCVTYTSVLRGRYLRHSFGPLRTEFLLHNTRRIHKINSVANIGASALRSRLCASVQSLLVRWDGTDTICRQSNRVHASSCVFTMLKKIERSVAYKMRAVIRFVNARNLKPSDIHRQLCEVYGEHAMSDSVVRRWVRDSLMKGERMCMMIHGAADRLWLMKVW